MKFTKEIQEYFTKIDFLKDEMNRLAEKNYDGDKKPPKIDTQTMLDFIRIMENEIQNIINYKKNSKNI